MSRARLNPQYLPKAKGAIEAAIAALKAADISAKAGLHRHAVRDLILAAEEISKAQVYYCVFTDIYTFDRMRAAERFYVPEQYILRRHDKKQSGFLGRAHMATLLSAVQRERKRRKRHLDGSPRLGPTSKKEFDALAILLSLGPLLETLRQSVYSDTDARLRFSKVVFRSIYSLLRRAVQQDLIHTKRRVLSRPDLKHLAWLQTRMPYRTRRVSKLLGTINSGKLPPERMVLECAKIVLRDHTRRREHSQGSRRSARTVYLGSRL